VSWTVSQAKQHFSEVVRAAAQEPQVVVNRGRPVAVVVEPKRFEEYEQARAKGRRPSLAEAVEELRRICAEDNWELEVPPRTDRPNAFVEALEEEDAADLR
jgi:prevent-host-death family protein